MSSSRAPLRSLRAGVFASAAVVAFAGLASSDARAVPAIALTSLNALRTFDTATPNTLGAPIPVTGLGTGEDLLGIDYRPATGQLFALGNLGIVYRINPTTGAATAAGAPLDPTTVPLNGSAFGFDFNPVVDRIRVTSDLGENYRLNPNDGSLVAVDTSLAYAAADVNAGRAATITGSAYTNNDNNPATGTLLYGIDVELGVLVTQDPPNNGTLNTVGSLGVAGMPAFAGFDIGGLANDAYALTSFDPPFGAQPALNATLYRINLTTGAATSLGLLGTGADVITGFTLVVVPEPTTLLACTIGLIGVMRRRGR